jgi:hypothetical protein
MKPLSIGFLSNSRARRCAAVGAAVALTALTATAGAARADSGGGWKPASGTLASTVVPQSIRPLGSNTLIVFAGSGVFSGTLSGPISLDPGGRWLIHADGSSVAIATGVANGAFGDCGSFTGIRYETVLFGQAQPDGSVTFSGFAVALGAQPVNYEIQVSGVIPAGGLAATSTYSGRYRCRG